MKKRKKLIVLGLILSLTGLAACKPVTEETVILKEDPKKKQDAAKKKTQKDEKMPEHIYVHVCGAVNNPGVYKLPGGARLYEAVAAAGGETEGAASEHLNQASVIKDGEQIYIPTREELTETKALEQSGNGEQTDEKSDGKVNLNTADKAKLMTLPGIGESKADAILKYRETKGRFEKTEQLMEITGIKEGVFQKIADLITAS